MSAGTAGFAVIEMNYTNFSQQLVSDIKYGKTINVDTVQVRVRVGKNPIFRILRKVTDGETAIAAKYAVSAGKSKSGKKGSKN